MSGECDSCGNHCLECCCVNDKFKALEKYDLIGRVSTDMNWISVKVGLPALTVHLGPYSFSENVLGWYEDSGEGKIWMFALFKTSEGEPYWHDLLDEAPGAKVLYWMRLPEAPQKENELDKY